VGRINQQEEVGAPQRFIDLLLHVAAGKDRRIAVDLFGLIEVGAVARSDETVVKLGGDVGAVAYAVRDEDLGITSLHAKPEHPSCTVYDSTVRSRRSGVILQRLDPGRGSRRFPQCGINGYRKKKGGIGPLRDVARNELISARGKSVTPVHDDEEVIPGRIAGPCWSTGRGDHLNVNLTGKRLDDVRGR